MPTTTLQGVQALILGTFEYAALRGKRDFTGKTEDVEGESVLGCPSGPMVITRAHEEAGGSDIEKAM